MEVIKTLTEEQIRAGIIIAKLTGLPVGGLTTEELEAELHRRTAPRFIVQPDAAELEKIKNRPPEHAQLLTDPRPPLKGVKAAAEYLGCGAKTIDRNLKKIPHYKIGRAYYFEPEELDRIKKEGGI